ncbi:sal-like protein 4 isoform X2 [Molossus molossus]|uniref:sal-like protein 4 isoform X2 n=1 Tax=Molossus molossus TaxID=27622 RepID=UPI001745E484|nr:sal-like protein 4 isoform X2 [Molossus molossus]
MSRRKQVKPQHVNLETDQGEKQLQQLAPDFADVAPVVPTAREPCAPMNHPETGDDMNGDQVKAKRLRREESHICEICCGEFFSFSEFSEHKKNCTKHIPVFIMNDSEGLVPSEDVIRAVVSHQPHSASSEDSHKKDGGNSLDMKKKPWVDSLLYSKMKTAQPPTPQDLSYLPKGGVTNTNVTLQALRGTKVAMDQQRAPMLPAPLPTPMPTPMPSDNSIPWVLEQILCLQQQQLQQIQLTEQIRVQVNLWATHAFHSSVAGAATLTSLDSHMSQQVQGPSLDSLKQATLPHENISSTTGYASPGLGSLALRPGGSRVPPNHLPGALISQASGSVVFQSPFSTVALDPSKKGLKGKPPNVSPVYVKPQNQATLYRYKCCSNLPSTFVHAQSTYVKVEVPSAFGLTTISPGMAPLLAAPPCQQGKQHGCTQFGKNSLASALQIHEKTHTGEKPFICNICEQAFTTKGSLQVHYMTHGANNSSAHCERKLAIENTTTLLGTDGKKLPEMDPQEIMSPSVNVDPVVWDQYTLMPTGGLAKTTNKISVIQRVGIPTLPVSLEASSIVNNTIVSKIDGSQPATSADVEKPGAADSILKHQLPHLLEEDKVSVS